MTNHDTRIRLASSRPNARPLLVMAAIIGMATGACSSETHHQFNDQGKLCVYPAAESQGNPSSGASGSYTYAAGQPLNLAVAFAPCLSGSCSRDVTASCSVAATGSPMEVTSAGSFVELSDTSCTDDCRFFVARCTTPPLDAGTYTFRLGTENLELTIPSTGPAPCAGQTAWP